MNLFKCIAQALVVSINRQTCLKLSPIHSDAQQNPQEGSLVEAIALFFIPLVGAIMALVLVSTAIVLARLPSTGLAYSHSFIIAASILLLWTLLTKAEELRALADALARGVEDSRLEAVFLVPLLLLKFACLQHLFVNQSYIAVFWAIIIARLLWVLLALLPLKVRESHQQAVLGLSEMAALLYFSFFV